PSKGVSDTSPNFSTPPSIASSSAAIVLSKSLMSNKSSSLFSESLAELSELVPHAVSASIKTSAIAKKIFSKGVLPIFLFPQFSILFYCLRMVLPHSNGKLRHLSCLHTFYSKRSEEHTSELQSRFDLVCRLLLDKKNYTI